MLVSSMAAAGLFHSAILGGPRAALASLLGAAVGTVFLMWPFARGLLGGGDVKLLGAVGAWVGVSGAAKVFLLAAVLGGFLSLYYLIRMKGSQRTEVRRSLAGFLHSGDLAVPSPEDLDRARGIPYGLAIAIAAVLVLLSRGPR